MQVTIARQLGLEPTTVGNFFMNARRRSMDKWRDEEPGKNGGSPSSSGTSSQPVPHGMQQTTPDDPASVHLDDVGHGHDGL